MHRRRSDGARINNAGAAKRDEPVLQISAVSVASALASTREQPHRAA